MWSVLWRLWKWLVHLVTGECEIQRLCGSQDALELKTMDIENSLRNSSSSGLRSIVISASMEVDEAVAVIVKEKRINLYAELGFTAQLKPCLTRIRGVRVLWVATDQLRAEAYSQDNKDHEKMLLELWSQLMPGVSLKSRVTKQWQDVGFQGDNPATDFRGMGVLSLHCMMHLASSHLDQARAMLAHSHHPQHGYSFAVVAINMTSLLYSLLEEGTLNLYLYSSATQWPLPLEQFLEMFCYVFYSFDKFWMERRPKNVMEFPALREEFTAKLRLQLSSNLTPQLMELPTTSHF